MTVQSARISQPDRRTLYIEELEERIAPVIITADPATWIIGDVDDNEDDVRNGWGIPVDPEDDFEDADSYWIFYLGPGQAHIQNTAGGEDLDRFHIGNITITGSTEESALFILDMPLDDTPDQDEVPWLVEVGTIWVQGDIFVDGDMGSITIGGMYGGGVPATITVNGNLGRLDVGILGGSVFATEDIYEVHVGSTVGAFLNDDGNWITTSPVTIAANGNIGALRVGVGLTDLGSSVESTGIFGGVIAGATTIRANANSAGPPGIIDLVEVRAGSLYDGSMGFRLADGIPSIYAGPGGNVRFLRVEGTIFYPSEFTVTSETPLMERTLVDDSGGVLVIHPQDTDFRLDDGTIVTYEGQTTFRFLPVARGAQPGVIVTRLATTYSNTFAVTGSVEVGELRSSGEFTFAEGLASDFDDPEGPQSIEELEITSANDVQDLEGYARLVFAGPGEADIYFVNAMGEYAPAGPGVAGTVPIVLNFTNNGDIVAVGADADIIYIGTPGGGGIGYTETISPYLLRGPLHYQDGDVVWVDSNTDPDADPSPYGVERTLMRNNSIYGAFAGGNIYVIHTTGAVGDVRTPGGNIGLVVANANGARNTGSPLAEPHIVRYPSEIMLGSNVVMMRTSSGSFFGKVHNDIGDGVFGRISTGTGATFRDSQEGGWDGAGVIGIVRVGEGLGMTVEDFTNRYPSQVYSERPGVWTSTGVFSAGHVLTVSASGVGNDIHGDIMGQGADPETGYGVGLVLASKGAAIDGNSGLVNVDTGEIVDGMRSYILAGYVDRAEGVIVHTSNIGRVVSDGPGGFIDGSHIAGITVFQVMTSGGAEGIFNTIIRGYGGGITSVSAGGTGIVNCSIRAAAAIGTVRTTAPDGVIADSSISAVTGLRALHTNALLGTVVDVDTIGVISTFDTIQDSFLQAGGIRTIIVRSDVTNSTLRVAGPLNLVRIGGSLSDSTVEATGPFGNIGQVRVTGDILNSEIFSPQNIRVVQSRTGSIINTDITAVGSGHLSTPGVVTRMANVARIQAAGSISGSINIGVMDNDNANLNVNDAALNVRLGTIRAGGNITANVNVGSVDWAGDIPVNLDVRAWVGTIVAGGGVMGDINVGSVSATPSGPLAGNIMGDVNINARLAAIRAGGSVTGDVSVGALSAAGTMDGDTDIRAFLNAVVSMGGSITGNLNAGSVHADNVNGDVNTISTIGVVRAPDAISSTISSGGVHAGSSVAGEVTLRSRLNVVRAGDDISGPITVGYARAAGAPMPVEGFGMVGSLVSRDGSITSDIDVLTNLSLINARNGDVGNEDGTISVGGRLGRVIAGSRNTVGDLLSDISVGGHAGLITATGAFPGSLDVGGNLIRLSVTGDAGELGDVFNIGGNLARLDIGDRDTFSNLAAAVNVGGNMNIASITGDVEDNIYVGGNVGRIVTGRIFSDITIAGNLSFLETGSGVLPGAQPPDYEFQNPGFPTGSLTVGGRIGIIR